MIEIESLRTELEILDKKLNDLTCFFKDEKEKFTKITNFYDKHKEFYEKALLNIKNYMLQLEL